MRQDTQFRTRLARDTAGNVLPIAAMGMLIAVVVVGSAVDLGRNYLGKQQLQSACDSAVLAGRRTVTNNGFDAASRAAADAYFKTNFTNATQGTRLTTFEVGSPDDGQTVTAKATTQLDTLLMRVAGKDSFSITVECSSSMGVGNADVMMVLDTTGSMDNRLSGSQTRIQALRAAMKNFYTTIDKATAASNARVRYGFVPFSSSVNVGRLINDIDTRYIVDSYDYQSRVYEPDSSGAYDDPDDWEKASSKAYSSSNCDGKVPANGSFSDYGSGSSKQQRRTEYTCMRPDRNSYYYIYTRTQRRPYIMRYRTVNYDTSRFKRFNSVTTPTGSNGSNQTTSWGGCIQERATVAQANFAYSNVTGITPKQAWDLDLDNSPNLNNPNTMWAPMWPEISYTRYENGSYTTNTTVSGALGGTYCPAPSRLLGTMSQSAFNAYADSLVASGGTYLDIGMIWGGRLASPQGMWADLVNDEPSNGGEISRHLIFMTDGEMEPNAYIPQAWGMEFWDRHVTNDGLSGDTARHTQRFLAVCEAVKDKGIRIWVVAFTSGLSNDLKTCASDDSSFTANSASDLNTAFQEIAKQVGELRVVS